jgi:predicted nucleic acid-binding protein
MNEMSAGETVVCRIAQIGLLRMLNNPAVMKEEALDTASCWTLWRRLVKDERILPAPIEPPGFETSFERFTHGRTFSPRLWTDAYLAAFAHAGGLELVTFDRAYRGFRGLLCRVLETGRGPS